MIIHKSKHTLVDRMVSTPPRGSRMINGCPELSAVLAMEPKVKLGEGTFGQVTKMGDYVVKEMPLKYKRDDVNFKRELEAWETLSQNEEIKPYIPPFCYGLIKPSGSLFGTGYLVHHFVPTMTLSTFLRTKKFLPLNQQFSVKLSKNLIHAFDLLYEAGYIHRDIKPANILIRDPDFLPMKDVVKPLIIDFGLVCKEPCTESDTIGTRSFMPQNWIPHDERNAVPFYRDPVITDKFKYVAINRHVIAPFFDQSTDMYSLGIVLRSIYKRTDWIRFKTPEDLRDQLGRDATDKELKLMKERDDMQNVIQRMFQEVTMIQASKRGKLVDPTRIPVNKPISNAIRQQFLENAPARRNREAALALERALANYNDNAENQELGYNNNAGNDEEDYNNNAVNEEQGYNANAERNNRNKNTRKRKFKNNRNNRNNNTSKKAKPTAESRKRRG